MTSNDWEKFSEYTRIRPDGCWEWLGYHTTMNYPATRFSGGRTMVSRLIWELWHGIIPEGHVVDHLCRNPFCVNPEHLEPVTQKENVHRGAICNSNLNKQN